MLENCALFVDQDQVRLTVDGACDVTWLGLMALWIEIWSKK